jgi:hypothetical protein
MKACSPFSAQRFQFILKEQVFFISANELRTISRARLVAVTPERVRERINVSAAEASNDVITRFITDTIESIDLRRSNNPI